MKEFDIIAKYFAPLASKSAELHTFNLLDDAALLTPKAGSSLVITSDAIVEGVHFFGHENADLIAKKALRSNLSDLAAKGAKPLAYSLTLHLPKNITAEWLEAFSKGLAEDQAEYGILLSGGDTVKSDTLSISITAFGEALPNYPSRFGAKAGDDIWLSGTIGDAALGLQLFDGRWKTAENEHTNYLRDRYLLPQPRTSLAPILTYANAAMDVSDGLLADLSKMLSASKVSSELHQGQLPLSDAAQWALSDPHFAYPNLNPVIFEGDDYEVLFTASPDVRADIEKFAANAPFALTQIGTITDQTQDYTLKLLDVDDQEVQVEVSGHVHGF